MSDVLPVDRTIGIRAEGLLADPDRCKFTVSRGRPLPDADLVKHPSAEEKPCRT